MCVEIRAVCWCTLLPGETHFWICFIRRNAGVFLANIHKLTTMWPISHFEHISLRMKRAHQTIVKTAWQTEYSTCDVMLTQMRTRLNAVRREVKLCVRWNVILPNYNWIFLTIVSNNDGMRCGYGFKFRFIRTLYTHDLIQKYASVCCTRVYRNRNEAKKIQKLKSVHIKKNWTFMWNNMHACTHLNLKFIYLYNQNDTVRCVLICIAHYMMI